MASLSRPASEPTKEPHSVYEASFSGQMARLKLPEGVSVSVTPADIKHSYDAVDDGDSVVRHYKTRGWSIEVRNGLQSHLTITWRIVVLKGVTEPPEELGTYAANISLRPGFKGTVELDTHTRDHNVDERTYLESCVINGKDVAHGSMRDLLDAHAGRRRRAAADRAASARFLWRAVPALVLGGFLLVGLITTHVRGVGQGLTPTLERMQFGMNAPADVLEASRSPGVLANDLRVGTWLCGIPATQPTEFHQWEGFHLAPLGREWLVRATEDADALVTQRNGSTDLALGFNRHSLSEEERAEVVKAYVRASWAEVTGSCGMPDATPEYSSIYHWMNMAYRLSLLDGVRDPLLGFAWETYYLQSPSTGLSAGLPKPPIRKTCIKAAPLAPGRTPGSEPMVITTAC